VSAYPWWRGAVVYQIYIRSFCDGNGDGAGDFAGLLGKIDYLAGLGVDAIWLSPIHPSPNRDWGYDVSDYQTVHPDYGTDDDFDRVLAAAHQRGLKVLTDEVLAHTSDEHPWFRESLQGGRKKDWYVWAPPRDDGTPPNNWLSAFAGEAWAYHPARRQYYHHKFLRQQPKLNWRNAEARKAALGVLEHWLARGVDGFRLDVANAYFHDPALTNNPPVPMGERSSAHWAHAPNLQYHFYDSNLADNIDALDEIRRTVDRFPDRFVMGEFSEEPERCGAFAAPDCGLHSGYSFPLLQAHVLGPDFIRAHFATLARYPDHWPSVAFSNHDIVRTVTRFGGADAPPELAKLMLALLLSLKGTALIYQGEELGLPEADLRRDQLKDPVGDLYYPLHKGRDGCRTPMPWDSEKPNLGFTAGRPWLPVAPTHRALAVSEQYEEPNSAFNFVRRFLSARKTSNALRWGEITFLDAPAPILAFERTDKAERVVCVFNMSAGPSEFAGKLLTGAHSLDVGSGNTQQNGGKLALGPYASWLARL
jgi:alpha-glucosidase